MTRLEDQRLLRDPNPPPPVVLVPATSTRPAIVAPPPPSDLLRLLNDGEARVRRRSALALGRVGLRDAVEPLGALLSDEDPDVREMSAFALGLIGDKDARPALLEALRDGDPRVQGRAAEALGALADPADAVPVSSMVYAHLQAGALSGVSADDTTYPLAPPVEAVRLGLFALARFGSYDSLVATVLDQSGRPVATWWPIAYALQRLGDPKSAPTLLQLLNTPGRFTAAFAAHGLGTMKAASASAPLREIVERRMAHPAVIVQAMRALAAIGDSASARTLTQIVADPEADGILRIEAMAALSAVATTQNLDLMLELVSDASPSIRGDAIRALSRIDPDTLLTTLSGLDPDRDWTVRTAEAAALGTLPPERGLPRLAMLLNDPDVRVIPAVLAALVASQAPGADAMLTERLKADDFAIRAAAARGLAQLKVAASVPALVDAYRAALGDSTYVARASILAALHEISSASARPLLEEALKDREWAVRVRAAALLGDAGPNEAIRPANSGRPISEDEWRAIVSPQFSPHAYVETDKGVIEIELAILDAPLSVANFMSLARKGFFDGTAIHRVVADFVVQDGDPRGDGEGGPGYTIRDEINMRPYLRGTVGMALDWEDTGGSQFFITHSPQPQLEGRYSVFGHVVAGIEVVDQLVPWEVIRRVRIWDGVSQK